MKSRLIHAYDSINYPRYSSYLRRRNINESKLLVLATIPRSGTHLIKFLFSNYINLICNGVDSRAITPREMNNFFPNNYQYSYLNLKARPFGNVLVDKIKKPTKMLESIDLNDFTRSHASFQKTYWKNSPVLHTYRNPLDYSVSMFHYMFKKRNSKPDINSPMDVFELYKEYYIETYLSYVYASKLAKFKLLRVPYEQLMKDKVNSFAIILHWLGLEPNDYYVEEACQRSSINKVIKLEGASKNKINPDASLQKGSFINNGSVGQWREYFSDSDIASVEKSLNKRSISLEDFDIG